MHSISHVGTSSLSAVPQTAAPNTSSPSGASFQTASTLTQPLSPASQGVSAGASRPLGSQMVSTLLQTQDLNQAQVHGHGGGGGSHHGGMKLAPSLEAEESAESEEAQLLKKRKKLADKLSSTAVSEQENVDEDGIPLSQDPEDAEETRSDKRKG